MLRQFYNQRSHVCSDKAPVFYLGDIRFEFGLLYIFVSLPRLTSEQERQLGHPDFFKSCACARHEEMWVSVWKHSCTHSKHGRKWRQVGFTQNKNLNYQPNRRIRGPWSQSGLFDAQNKKKLRLISRSSKPQRSPCIYCAIPTRKIARSHTITYAAFLITSFHSIPHSITFVTTMPSSITYE